RAATATRSRSTGRSRSPSPTGTSRTRASVPPRPRTTACSSSSSSSTAPAESALSRVAPGSASLQARSANLGPMGIRRVALLVALAVGAIAVVTVGVGGLGAALTPGTAAPHGESVLLIGDSLMDQAAPGVAAALPGSSVVDEAVPGSGLLDGSVDWFARAEALVERYRPDVVMVSFVGNYDASKGTLVADTPEYYTAWADAAQR